MEGQDSIRSIFESVGLTGSETVSPSRDKIGRDADESSRLGRECMKDGDYIGAEAHFQNALKQGARPAEGYLNLASAQEAGEKPEEAFEAYELSFNTEPSVEAAVGASYALRAQSRRREAKAWLEKAAETDPESVFPHRRLAELSIESREYTAAAAAALKAMQIAPDDAEIHLWASELLLDAGRAVEALSAAQKAQAQKPMSAEPVINQALALAVLDRLPEAVRQLQLAHDLEPQSTLPAVLASIFDPEQNLGTVHPFDAYHLLRLIDRPSMDPQFVETARKAVRDAEKDV